MYTCSTTCVTIIIIILGMLVVLLLVFLHVIVHVPVVSPIHEVVQQQVQCTCTCLLGGLLYLSFLSYFFKLVCYAHVPLQNHLLVYTYMYVAEKENCGAELC